MDDLARVRPGALYLIPVPLGPGDLTRSIPAANLEVIRALKHFIVEELRSARRFIRQAGRNIDIDGLDIALLNEHTPQDAIPGLLQPLLDGHDAGYLSEAGIPCVADPGSLLVRFAHEHRIRVVPLPGPSSIFLALMASGFQGQRFVFHGYLPVEAAARDKAIREMETAAYRRDETQLFMETPYRNEALLEALLRVLKPGTLLCLALDLTQDTEEIVSMRVSAWKKKALVIHKRPAVFLIYRQGQ